MFKQVFFLLSFLSAPAFLKSQNADFLWAKQIVGGSSHDGRAIVTDSTGSVITVGTFIGTADFDPGPAFFWLTAVNGYNDGFIQKISACGDLEWAKRVGGSNDDLADDVSLDAYGNIYVTGDFRGTVDFDPGAGIFNLTAVANWDAFILKLDPLGNFVWAKAIGGIGSDWGSSIKTDANGDLFASGTFKATVDFDPGPGNYTLTAAGSWDVFIVKLDSAGNFLWASVFGGSLDEELFSIDIDAAGCAYLTGYYYGTMDCDPGPAVYNLTAIGGKDAYIEKLDSAGNFLWAKSIGGSSRDEGVAIRVNQDAVYISGLFTGNADFDPGPAVNIINSPASYYSGFLLMLDSAGIFNWVKIIGGTDEAVAYGLTLDASKNIICGGYFKGTVDLDPGPSVSNSTSLGNSDVFILKLDSAGNFTWKKMIGSTDADAITSIALNNSNEIHTTGYYRQAADFDPGPGVFNMIPFLYNTAAFILKLGTVPVPAQLDSLQLEAATICAGQSIFLIVHGNLNSAAAWVLHADSCSGPILASNTTGYFALNPTTTTTYYVRAEGGCMNPGTCAAATLTVYPSYSFSESHVICSNSSYTFPDSTIQSNITGTVIHTSHFLSILGCDSAITTTVEVDSLPAINYIQSPSIVCLNWQPITLSSATPANGVYSGTGVSGNTFDPSLSGTGSFTVFYTYTDSLGCSDSAQQQITVDLCMGIREPVASELEIVPNPFSDFTMIYLPEKLSLPCTLSLYDFSGRKASTEKITNSPYRLERNDLPTGIYLCVINDPEGKLIGSKKIIIK
jgi:hypothetical protein